MPLFGSPNFEKLKAKRDVPKLVKLLKHKDYLICARAINILGEIGDERAVDPLVTVLRGFQDLKPPKVG